MSHGIALRGAGAAAMLGLLAVLLGIMAGGGALSSPGALIAVALGVAGGAAAGYLAFRFALDTVTAAADRFVAEELDRRIESPPESPTHAPAFTTMSRRLQGILDTTAAEHARLEAVFEAATDALIAISRDARTCFLNRAALEILDTSREWALGRPFIETCRDFELDAVVRRAIDGRQSGEATVITFGPRRIPLRAVAVPIEGGGYWAVLLVLNDLTDVTRLDQVRRDFLGNVSHELRTPLAAIRALVETLEAEDLAAPEAPEFLRRIRQQVERLTLLVNELLDLSRIESGAIHLQPEPVDVAAAVAEAASLLRVRSETTGVAFECPPLPGPVVEADRTSVLRIVGNLLDNAVKFSPAGSIVYVHVRDEGPLVALSVEDSGPGIPAQDLPRVFERFFKADHSRAESGVGLGLAIVKHLVRAHGGTVEAASQPGAGATFTVRLPRSFVGARPAPPRPAP